MKIQSFTQFDNIEQLKPLLINKSDNLNNHFSLFSQFWALGKFASGRYLSIPNCKKTDISFNVACILGLYEQMKDQTNLLENKISSFSLIKQIDAYPNNFDY